MRSTLLYHSISLVTTDSFVTNLTGFLWYTLDSNAIWALVFWAICPVKELTLA